MEKSTEDENHSKTEGSSNVSEWTVVSQLRKKKVR